jgi:lipopolysaccharide/colanic/teichoic acid biosynthesis glycosyltransferase
MSTYRFAEVPSFNARSIHDLHLLRKTFMPLPVSSHESRTSVVAASPLSISLKHKLCPETRALHAKVPAVSRWTLSFSKRLFDIAIAVAVLSAFALPMLLIALCVRLTSRGPAIFVQQRVGRHGRLFSIYKFRSMYCNDCETDGPGLTGAGDRRVTLLGRWLRRLKLDELPQLFNILRGDMSLVGPRPKLPQYSAATPMPYRPGVTGAATLAFRCEEELLSSVPPSQIEAFYHRSIKPLKTRLDSSYMYRATFWSDLRLIAATLVACLAPARRPISLRKAFSVVTVLLPEMRDNDVGGGSFEAAG